MLISKILILNNVILNYSLFEYSKIYTTPAQLMQAAGCADITITKHACLLKACLLKGQGQGYLFVFVSNDMEHKRNSPNPLKNNKQAFGQSQGSVYFDDLTACPEPVEWVTHTPGPLLEEHHYYPTGLEMFALSSSAGNGHVRNRYTPTRGRSAKTPLHLT
jgi:hypothetical protein